MKRSFYFVLMFLVMGSLAYSQGTKISYAYNFPPNDSILSGLNSIRGVYFADNPFGDGKSAILMTNYLDNGHVHLFVCEGNDSLQLVWTSPTVAQNGGGSTPRYAIIGDLDNDGLPEIIYQSAGNGIYIYEWDGVAGGYNFGTEPSQVIEMPTLTGVGGNLEYMEEEDIDGDGQNELLVAYNGSSNADDGYYVISANGDWATDSPGFSGFNVEAHFARPNLTKWGGDGSPYAMIAAQLDGTGNDEILVHNWNHKNVFTMTVPSANTYKLSDTTNNKQNIELGGADDDVALFGGIAFDVDNDGRQEVYLPTYTSNSAHYGLVHMIHYEQGQSTSEIDSSNVFTLDLSSVLKSVGFGIGYGDIDGNGKPNIYVSSVYPYNLVSAEYEGGDKTDMNNWKVSLLYKGEDDIYTDITTKDSAGTVDTTYTVQPAFASKIWARYTDFDKDGHEDILMPYQAINDSVNLVTLTYNSGTGKYDTTSSTKMLNPKRWGFRILESTGTTGIRVKDLTVITPDNYKLEQNYPNPFNPTTNIRFELPIGNNISLKVYDISGREVKTLISNQRYNRGSYEVTWDGTNNHGEQVASGVYIYRLNFGNFSKSMKMTLLK